MNRSRPEVKRAHASALIVAGYVLVRILVADSSRLVRTYDSEMYEGRIDFLGGAERPWLLPLLYRLFPDWATITVQMFVSGVALSVLAIVVGRQMRTRAVGIGAGAAILLIGVSPRVTSWDNLALTESLAVALTLLLVAACCSGGKVWCWAVPAVFVGWVFVRDAHALLAVPVLGDC